MIKNGFAILEYPNTREIYEKINALTETATSIFSRQGDKQTQEKIP